MSQLKYHQKLTLLVDNSLLHLYMFLSNKKGHTSVCKRNELLVKWLKPKVKDPSYKIIKRDIKALIASGRNKKGNIEDRLWELNKINNEHKAKFTHADKLYILFTHLYEHHNYESKLTNSVDKFEEGVIYMSPSEIETGFNDDSVQIRPLEIFIFENHANSLVQAIHNFGGYTAEVTKKESGFEYIKLSNTNINLKELVST